MTRCVGILGLAFILACAGCASTPLRETPWIVVNSPSFEIFSTMSEKDTKTLVQDLERFRALVYRITNARQVASPIPTRIVALASRSRYNDFAPSGSVGFFWPGLRANTIMLTDYSSKLGAAETILHEYVHFILRNGEAQSYPVWYDEGFAEFLSTAKADDGMMIIGSAPDSRIPSLQYGNWVPLRKIISASQYSDIQKSDRHMIWAESWALVYYLALERNGRVMSEDLTQYMAALRSGMSPEQAFESAFDESVRHAERAIRSVIRRGKVKRVGLPVSELEYDANAPTMRIPGSDEVAVRLGQIWLSLGKLDEAKSEFAAALVANPLNARAQAGMGDVFKFRDQFDGAAPYFERSVELDPGDPLNQIDLAEYYDDRALQEESAAARDQLFVRSREIYREVLSLDPKNPEAWVMLGRTHLAPGQNPIESLEPISQAMKLLPSSTIVLSSLVEAYVANGQIDQARRLLIAYSAARSKGSLGANVDTKLERILKTREKVDAAGASENGEESMGEQGP